MSETKFKWGEGAKVAIANATDVHYRWGTVHWRYSLDDAPWYVILMGDGSIVNLPERRLENIVSVR